MLDITLSCCILLAIWGFFFYAAFRDDSNNPYASRLRKRIFTWLGATLLLGSFFQPWIRFDASEYINNWIFGVSKEVTPLIFDILGKGTLAKAIDILFNEASLNAIPVATILAPMIKGNVLTIWFLGFLDAAAFLWLSATTFFKFPKQHYGDIVILFLSILGFFFLLRTLPVLDSVGGYDDLRIAVIGVLLGAHIGNGPFIALAGVLILALGSLYAISNDMTDSLSMS